jgi:hypothetical protein
MSHIVKRAECKVCNEEKDKISLGSYRSKESSKRWVDLEGKQWNGRICPDCQRKRARSNMHIIRENRRLAKKDE